jgi:diacylglycerol kinase family enzyme
MSRRLGAIAALAGAVVALTAVGIAFVEAFPRGLAVPLCTIAALVFAWLGLLRRGARRLIAFVLAALALGTAIGVLLSGGHVLELLVFLVASAVGSAGARSAFAQRKKLRVCAPPSHPVLFVNPRSGDGRAGRVGLQDRARKRGMEVVELGPGDDLELLVREAVARGANGLGMAGGDGSQALVAAIAAEHDLPYACIPAGTRNHFALDLGVDRDDVVGALEAFGSDGGERLVDLGEVNGRVFVNNVSLGVYAEAVGQDGYREAKLRTLLDTIPAALGTQGSAQELRWHDSDGVEQRSSAMILVSNNAYRLGSPLGSGTRPRLDGAVLGVVEFRPPGGAGNLASGPPLRELEMPELEVEAEGPVPLGVDGESIVVDPPLLFRSRPGALRVRIASAHPGASPSATLPRSPLEIVAQLTHLALQGDRVPDPGG